MLNLLECGNERVARYTARANCKDTPIVMQDTPPVRCAPERNANVVPFIVFQKDRVLTEDDRRRVLQLEQAPASARVMPGNFLVDVAKDLVVPLAREAWLLDTTINSRLGHLQAQTKDSVVLPTIFWVSFLRDSNRKQERSKQYHLGILTAWLAAFALIRNTVTRVFVPLNTGKNTSRGLHWKLIYVVLDATPTQKAGSIWDFDSLSSRTGWSSYRELMTDVYNYMRPGGPAAVPQSRKMSDYFDYPLMLPSLEHDPHRVRQHNGFDCGMFVLAGAESLVLRHVVEYNHGCMDSFRTQLLLQFADCCLPQVCPHVCSFVVLTCVYTSRRHVPSEAVRCIPFHFHPHVRPHPFLLACIHTSHPL